VDARIQNLPDASYRLLETYCKFRFWNPVAADLEVLAIAALQVTVGKKDIAEAPGTADRGLFPAMKADGADGKPGAGAAIAQFTPNAVGMAVARATSTIS
jgi:hypothetical protein